MSILNRNRIEFYLALGPPPEWYCPTGKMSDYIPDWWYDLSTDMLYYHAHEWKELTDKAKRLVLMTVERDTIARIKDIIGLSTHT